MSPNTIKLGGILTLLITAASAFWGNSAAVANVRLAFDSTQLDFGKVAVFGSKDLVLEVWDTASVAIEIDQITTTGIDASDFSVLSPTSSTVLNPGATVHTQIIVQFSPQVLGIRTGSLLIETTDGNVIIPLTGNGAGNEATLAWSLDSVNFGTITPGSERDSVIELYSTGTDTAFLEGIQIAAGDTSFAEQVAGGFQPPLKLAPGDSIAVQIAFRGLPLTGLKDAQLSALSSTSNIPSCVLTGDVELGSFEIQPPSLIDFGTMYVGQIRDSTIFLINTSALDLRIEDLSLSPSGDDFTIINPTLLPFTLGMGDTLAIPIRANPGLATSHEAQLQVFSQSADTRFLSATLMVSVIPAALNSPSNQELDYYCASGVAASDTIPVANTGSDAIVITGLAFEDTNTQLVTNAVFPDTIAAGSTRNLILDFNPSTAASDTQVLQFMGGTQVMFADTIALHPSVENIAASLTMTAANGVHQNIAVASTASLGPFDLDSIVVHLGVQDSNVASIDPSTIVLTASLANASIVSILPEADGYTVTISSTSPISVTAGSPLLHFALDRFVSAADSTNISVSIETPQRSGCIAWSADTTQAGGIEACGSLDLRNALLQRPLLLSASLRQEPVTGSDADLRIDASREIDARYEVSNALGKTIFQSTLHVQTGLNDYRLPLSGVASGTYIIRLLPANGSAVSVRFLKLH